MSKEILVVGIGSLILGLIVAPLVLPALPDGWGGPMMYRDATPVGAAGRIDAHFIEQMIPHHEGAIAMAGIALERSRRPEILSLANGIIEAQERENRDMRAWYQEWFGSAPIARHGMGMMHMGGMEGDTEALRRVSDAEFDREFMLQMIPHHEMAIVMARMLQASTEREEMKMLADAIITSQSREILMMQSWLESWY
ncbi:DUF305 domain-containing protein [Candidatus Parcubacteria bacterium]|nr:MAG: DUF305 domain-containing protein [Candidatus Parcubacteria bacterium]